MAASPNRDGTCRRREKVEAPQELIDQAVELRQKASKPDDGPGR